MALKFGVLEPEKVAFLSISDRARYIYLLFARVIIKPSNQRGSIIFVDGF